MEKHGDLLERLKDEMGYEYISDLKVYKEEKKYLSWILNQSHWELHEIKDTISYIFDRELKSDSVKACRKEIEEYLSEL